jgi:hypothetical protein
MTGPDYHESVLTHPTGIEARGKAGNPGDHR